MKIKYFLLFTFSVTLFIGCKSKKVVTYKPKKIQPRIESPTKKVTQVESTKSVGFDSIMTTEAYINKYKDIAMEEMREYKIPASITLAQGIVESSSGNSELTKKSNNHFGIKCHLGWEGPQVSHDDDEKGECFRKYDDPIISFKDHSLFLTSRSRYEKLFKLEPNDYVNWAKELKKAGYATDKSYPNKLIALIEKYQLYVFDEQVLGKPIAKDEKDAENIYVVAKGDTLYSISKRFGLKVDDLKKMNDLDSNAISIGQTLLLN